MNISTKDTFYISVFLDDIPKPIYTNKTIDIGFEDSTFNWGMMHKNDRWVLFTLS